MADAPTTINPPRKISVLFVCLGNICRSPMAEGVFRSLTHNLSSSTSQPHSQISRIDSAGTAGYHTSAPPDSRTTATLTRHGIRGYVHGARKVRAQDFEEFDYILAMDEANLRDLKRLQGSLKEGKRGKAEVRLFGEFGGKHTGMGDGDGEEVGDPYYGEDDGFEVCYEQVRRFGRAFLRDVLGDTGGEEAGEGS